MDLLEEAKSLYENITSRVTIHQREPFAPAGLVPSDLINHFQQLDQVTSHTQTCHVSICIISYVSY